MMIRIKTVLKNIRCIYWIYNICFSAFLKLLSLFIKIDDNLILFNAYGGQKYGDSPKNIYDYMKTNNRYKKYKMIWAIDNPNLLDEGVEFVKNNTFSFFITALKAKYWITNSSMERGLKFKRNNQVYINTTHSSNILKYFGKDLKTSNTKFRVSEEDIMYVQCKVDAEIAVRALGIDMNKIKIVGLPRNDELAYIDNKKIIDIKKKLNIPLNKKIIMYAPTFREYNYDTKGNFISPPINIEKWKKNLENEYIVLFKAHYEVNRVLNIIDDNFIRNVSDYGNVSELLMITDVLISDYSSIVVDYSILERPVFTFPYDYDKYMKERGMYIDLKDMFKNNFCLTEDELLDKITKMDLYEQIKISKKIKELYVEKYGNATEYIDNIIEPNY